MKRPFLLLGAALFSALVAGVVRADDDHDEARRLQRTGEILSLEAILEKQRAKYPGARILEVEFEYEHGRYVYEIEWVDPDGTVRELEVDAHSGELLTVEE